jgi:hypothetical protein
LEKKKTVDKSEENSSELECPATENKEWSYASIHNGRVPDT